MKHLVDPMDLSVDEIYDLLDLADHIVAKPQDYYGVCRAKKLATLFFEPSTRTRLSFEAAMLDLGGSILNVASSESSSAAKGESVSDTIRTVSCYSDIIAIRHAKEGAAYVATKSSNVPIINAGDGGHQHPTQTLTDIMTIHSVKNRLNNLTIGVCGDLKFGRTVHSLIRAMSRYEGITFVLISPEDLKVPGYVREDILIKNNIPFIEVERMETVIHGLDILYMTRVQRERFFNEEDYVRLKDSYILDRHKMSKASKDMIVMHPLPRVNEISLDVDSDPRAVYFEQVRLGKFVRMALIMKLLGVGLC